MTIKLEDSLTDAIDLVEGSRQLMECAANCGEACPLSWEGASVIEEALERSLEQLRTVRSLMIDKSDEGEI